MDTHSHARPEQVRVTHVALDLTLDFTARAAHGSVTLALERADPSASLRLDCKGPAIESVTGSDGGARAFAFGASDEHLGAPLTIALAAADTSVRIRYRTNAQADALQWLTPEQTAGGKRPFLFSQGQAILTRTWIPLQDTPGNRVTYEARITAPEDLRVVMSAERSSRDADGTWRFAMTKPIPPYLIALACGDLAFAKVSERCGIYAEPSILPFAQSDLSDVESMVQAAERLFGPYRWGRYDVLILPPSFPFGGMENPCLTFATPTILTGDKSLVALIAHELAHSWSGNLVTNATWRDFWLNEGFTVYCEHRIMEAIYGKERAQMETLIGLQGLEKELIDLAPKDQVLHIDLTGRNPDDGMTAAAYDKGALFLTTLEAAFGRERFDRFLARWFDTNGFRSVRTADFERFLASELFAGDRARMDALEISRWLRAPGIPPGAVRPEGSLFRIVDAALGKGTSFDPKGWVTQQWLYYLNKLPDTVSATELQALDARFHLTLSLNAEILCAWLGKAIRAGYAAADARLEEFLLAVGRRKFLKPLYEELMKTQAGAVRARAIYAKARPRYHAVATRTLDGIVQGQR